MMKKFLALFVLLALLCIPAALAESPVPLTTREVAPIPAMPDAPAIVRCVQSGDTVSLRFDRALPAEHMLSFLALDDSYRVQSVRYVANGSDFVTESLPADGAWLRIELAWVAGGDNALAQYSMSGRLTSVTQFDDRYNGYVFSSAGAFTEHQNEQTGVYTRFSESGEATCYSYMANGMRVWFDLAGNVLWATYHGSGYECTWDADNGWHIETPTGRVKVRLDLNPREVAPLVSAPAEPTPTVEVVWYPNNTIALAGLSLQEASRTLPDKWYNVIPVDLTHDGRQTYYLTVSNARFIGECYVDVWGDEVTVTCEILDHSGIELVSEYGRWFTRLSDIDVRSIEDTANAIPFGEPMSIEYDLEGADVALLFIRSKATYRQPFRDGSELTRYWRNKPDWKEFRQNLTTLMRYVEK